MLEQIIHGILPPIISVIELVGIFVVTFGAAKAFFHYLRNNLGHGKYEIKFELAESLATGLEFKMASEILKTVLIRDLNEIYILGSIILLRAILSFMIHMEIKASQHGEPHS